MECDKCDKQKLIISTRSIMVEQRTFNPSDEGSNPFECIY